MVPRPLKLVGRLALDASIALTVFLFIPGLPPYESLESFRLTPARSLQGKLAPNQKLALADPILKNEILGPESIAIKGGEVFTGLIGGEVIGYKSGKVRKIVKFGKDCDGKIDEQTCGRPLGMRFDAEGNLVVADAYYGVFKVNVDSGTYETLWSSQEPIKGKKPMIPNDLCVAKDGKVYFSDSSTNVHLQNALQELLDAPSGRLIMLDTKTNETEVLVEGLQFANGVQLSDDESAILVGETARYRVWKYHLSGSKQGSKELFIDGLPGSPDNIRSNGRGGFYISLIAPRYSDKFSLADAISPYPLLRKFILRTIFIVHSSLKLFNLLLPNPATKSAEYYIGHFEPIAAMLPHHGHVLEVDESGEILNSFQDDSGKVAHISEFSVDEEGKYAYLGSPYNREIWKIDLKSLYED